MCVAERFRDDGAEFGRIMGVELGHIHPKTRQRGSGMKPLIRDVQNVHVPSSSTGKKLRHRPVDEHDVRSDYAVLH